MVELAEQVLEIDLPVALVDPRGFRVAAVPGVQEPPGLLALEGKARVGLRARCHQDDPAKMIFDVRVLDAHYVPPSGCSPEALKACHELNRAMTEHLIGQ